MELCIFVTYRFPEQQRDKYRVDATLQSRMSAVTYTGPVLPTSWPPLAESGSDEA
jgi:hypothetical protein